MASMIVVTRKLHTYSIFEILLYRVFDFTVKLENKLNG